MDTWDKLPIILMKCKKLCESALYIIAERISARQLIRVHMSAMRTYVRGVTFRNADVTFRNVECHV